MRSTDKKLIDAHCQGSPTAFEELVRRYGSSLLGYLQRMCGSRDLAEDFFQETFKRVYEKAHTFRGESFKSWLFTIATRIVINSQRRNRLKLISLNKKTEYSNVDCEELKTAAVLDNSDNPSDRTAIEEQKEQLRAAIRSLPDKQRATLILAYYEQLTYPQVAQVMDCSVGTVKTQMYRALRTLSKKLGEFNREAK
jgi:RNA polymerase sigma-70 factor (ECF subfamily)